MFLHDHPALGRIPAKHRKGCLALWAMARSWADRWSTDGFVPASQVELLGGTEGEAELLVSSGLWAEDYQQEDGYLVKMRDVPRPDDQPAAVEEEASQPMSGAERARRYRASRRRDGQRDAAVAESVTVVTASVTEDLTGVTASVTAPSRWEGKGGSEISGSSLSSPSRSPSPPGSELDQLAGCNAGARDAERDGKPNPGRLQWELEELVRGEFASRGVTAQKASRKQWLDGCVTVQEALDLGLYPDARAAMKAFATKLVDAVAAGKPEQLGFALQQVMLGEQLKPLAGGRKLSQLAQDALARQRGGA